MTIMYHKKFLVPNTIMKCMLEPDINQCPYYVRDQQRCAREEAGTCTFQEPEEEPAKPGYERKERWYDKYYKY